MMDFTQPLPTAYDTASNFTIQNTSGQLTTAACSPFSGIIQQSRQCTFLINPYGEGNNTMQFGCNYHGVAIFDKVGP